MAKNNNGGYFALKGFIYQFDKSLIEILDNPRSNVELEHIQDINYDNFVLQIKHKETQSFSNSKIRDAVIQLLDIYKENTSKYLCLYCHFKDKIPQEWLLKLSELNSILGNKQNQYKLKLKRYFINRFYIKFSEDYESQFSFLINLIKNKYSLSNSTMAYIYHSIFQSKLLKVAISRSGSRIINKSILDGYIRDAEKTIFYSEYSKYLNKNKYEKLIKKTYFTFNRANIDNFERLFIIYCDNYVTVTELCKIVYFISKKYFRVSKSPPPYLSFLNLRNSKLLELKIKLADRGFLFNDGTMFGGDRFRIDIMTDNYNKAVKAKIIDFRYIQEAIKHIDIHEIFQFYLNVPKNILTKYDHTKIQINETKQILKML